MIQFTPGIFVFDIDNTLADNSQRVHYLRQEPKNWDAFFADQINDTVILPISIILKSVHPYYDIIYLTGRGEEWRNVTDRWLNTHNMPHGELIMRPLGCREDDTTLKIRLLKEYLTEDERMSIMTIFEDRNRVVAALRKEGYHVCHVDNTEF